MKDTRPNLGTALLVLAIFAAFAVAQHRDMTDHSAEFAQAQAIDDALTDAQQQRRRDVAAQYACGPNSAHEWVSPTVVQCFTKRGRKAGELEVAAK